MSFNIKTINHKVLTCFFSAVALSCGFGAEDSVVRSNTYFGPGANKDGQRNVSIGVESGSSSSSYSSPESWVSVGYNAGLLGWGDSRISIGDSAGYNGRGGHVISIGQRAGENTSGTRSVYIGDYEHTNVTKNSSGVTSINGRQIYINGSTREFAISPAQDAPLTNAPLYFKDECLHLNARIVIDSAAGDSGRAITSGEWARRYIDSCLARAQDDMVIQMGAFDIFMAPYGDDKDSGSKDNPKATFEGCMDALGSAGGRVGVFPGQYCPITLVGNEDGSMLYNPTGTFHFVAIGGKERTSIVGRYTNSQGYDDGLTHTLAFAHGNQTFEGFTISKIGSYKKTRTSDGTYLGSAPAFSCLTLKNCDIIDCSMQVGYCYGAFNTCYLENTSISHMVFDGYSTSGDTEMFINCAFVNSKMTDCVFSNCNYSVCFGTATECYYSAFSLPKQTNNEHAHGYNNKFEYCTFVWDMDGNEMFRVAPTNAVNCYFCVGNGSYSGGVSNVFTSVSDTKLSKDLVPNSIDCLAVRANGVRDAGWRDSGLGALKEVYQRMVNAD